MKLTNLDVVLKDLKGVDIFEEDNKGNKTTFTLKEALIRALSLPPSDKSEMKDVIEATKEYKLGIKIVTANADMDFSSEEISLLKQKVCKIGCSAILSGQVCEMLENGA